MARLSTAQITAMRALDPEDATPAGTVAPRTLRALRRVGAVNGDGQLTSLGLRTVRSYVRRTGDGPEALKELLRF